MSKTKGLKLPLGKAIRASIYYTRNEDGSLTQVINHIFPTGLKKQIPIFSTNHGKVNITEKGLHTNFQFDREKMGMQEIVQAMYDEADDIMGWLNSDEATAAIKQAEEEFAKQNLKRFNPGTINLEKEEAV